MKETFVERNIVERTNKAGIRLEGQNEKTESFGRIYGVKYS